MYLQNCYYMAGWSADFTADTLSQVQLLGQLLVIYRRAGGTLVALEDRCCHRAAPLSLGRREGDDVRCMYHGLRFGPDGNCTELPGQPVIPAKVCVKAYPTVEKHGIAWVWMGDPAKADEELVPPFVDVDDPDWALSTSHLDVAAEAQLLVDNLLDVSHAPYVHEATFAGDRANAEKMIAAEHAAVTTRLERGVRVERWIRGREGNRFLGGIATDDFAWNEVHVPGVFAMYTNCFPAGTADRIGELRLPDWEPLLSRFVGQVIAPVSAGRCKLYYAAGPWRRHSGLKDVFFQTVTRAFKEDEAMIEGQQKVIDTLPDRAMMPLGMDGPLTRFEGIVRKLAVAEAAQAPARGEAR